MPGLLRGVARTAVIAGTASAVNGRVQRRQQARFAAKDAEAAQQQGYPPQEAYPPQQEAYPPQQMAAPAASDPTTDKFEQLKTLGELKAQGVLTEEEFAQEKAKLLAN